MKRFGAIVLGLILACGMAGAQTVTPDAKPHHGSVITRQIKSNGPIRLDTVGTSQAGSQFMGATPISGDYNLFINGAQAFQITDNWWNPNVSYQGAPTAWLVASSGALAGGPDNIAVLGCNSSIYPGTATGCTQSFMARGTTGFQHFWNNGYINFTVAGGSNPNGNDTYNTSSYVSITGTPSGSSNNPSISVQDSGNTAAKGLTIYTADSGSFSFQSDNTASTLFNINRGSTSGGDGLALTAQTSGSGPLLQSISSGSSAPLTLASKGTAATGVMVNDGGARQFEVFGGNTSTSYLQASGGVNSTSLSAQGGTNPAMTIYTTGTGGINFQTANTADTALTLTDTASSVDFLNITGAASGNPGTIPLTATGSDSNININCVAKGSGTCQANGSTILTTAGTGLSKSGSTLNSNAVYQVAFQPGLLTSVTNTKSVYGKISKTTTVDNIEGSAFLFSCVSNPTITMYECGTSTTCASPTTIGSVTVTSAGTVVDGTISNSAITAGDYIAWAISAGTCTSLDIAATAQVHSN